MKSIIVEIRDRATLIPAMATKLSTLSTETIEESRLIERAGFGQTGMVLLTKLNSGHCNWDPYKWTDSMARTMFEAHKYITEHYDELSSGDVIDVEYILGESEVPKVSEVN